MNLDEFFFLLEIIGIVGLMTALAPDQFGRVSVNLLVVIVGAIGWRVVQKRQRAEKDKS